MSGSHLYIISSWLCTYMFNESVQEIVTKQSAKGFMRIKLLNPHFSREGTGTGMSPRSPSPIQVTEHCH